MNTLWKIWNKILLVTPFIWGILIVIITTLSLLSIGVLLGAFILRAFGVV